MARLQCKCGQQLSNSTNPEIEYKVFSDEEWISLLDRTDAGENPINFVGNSVFFWKCLNCKRLYFFKDNLDKPVAVYQEEINNDILSK